MMIASIPPEGNSAGNPHDILRTLFRHKRKMAICFVSTMSLVVLGLIFYPRSYSSS
jgi:hypothetical protein